MAVDQVRYDCSVLVFLWHVYISGAHRVNGFDHCRMVFLLRLGVVQFLLSGEL